jgi:predicted DNA binding CopG/RHH family protein
MNDPMKDPMLDAEEKELLESVERGEWVPVKDMKKWRAELQEAARNTLRKEKRINIRLSAKDLFDIQTAAAEEGMPYQTLISSIIHKYAAGTLIDRRSLIVSEEPVPYKTRPAKKTKLVLTLCFFWNTKSTFAPTDLGLRFNR